MKEINGKKLSDWAKENNIPYKKAWRLYQSGELPVKAKETKTGRIMIESKASEDKKETTFGVPLISGETNNKRPVQSIRASDPARRNKAATSHPSDEYWHILHGVEPFVINNKGGYWDTNFAINLCQKAYWNFSVFRNTIDAMTEFSVNKLYFRGGSAKSQDFFKKLLDAIKYLDLQDKFFREYYRSGNVFLYRFECVPVQDDLQKLSKIYGFDYESAAAQKVKLPSKYVILNPCDVGVQANIAFANVMMFFKRLNGYEIHRLREAASNPKNSTEEEINFLKSLPKITQDQIKAGAGAIIIPLDPDIVYAVFYKKQDYEPLSIPMGYPVLKDIEWKAEMKHIDMAVSRTMQNVVLLITMGYESKNAEYMFDQKAALAMQELFQNETVGKTLVADFTTKVEWKIPTIGDFLDPKKYQIVNDDIKMGLNYILTGSDQKFSNQYIQVQLFIQRLTQARQAFIDQFLMPEIKRISKLLGFKNYPTPYFEDINLKDDLQFNRIITQLATLGILTPGETFDAIETGRIPTSDESLEAQQTYKQQREKGYYQPLMGGPFAQKQLQQMSNDSAMDLQQDSQDHETKMTTKQHKHEAANPPPAPPPAIHINTPLSQVGRPSGTTGPKTTNKPRVMKADEEFYSLTKIKDNLISASKLEENVKKELLKKFNSKKLDDNQLKIAEDIKRVIIANENPENWNNKIKSYVENPVNGDEQRLREIDAIAIDHGIDPYLASILYLSKK